MMAAAAMLLGCGAPGVDGAQASDAVAVSCRLEASRAEIAALESLNLRGCGDIDFRPLWEATGLRELVLDDPDLEDIRGVAPIRSLQTLRFERSRVHDLDPVGPLSGLRELAVLDTPLTNLSPLARVTSLERLDISDTYVVSLAPLESITGLKELVAHRTRISDLRPLLAMPGLEVAGLSENGVADPRPLLEHPNLARMRIDLSGNCIDLDDPAVAEAVQALEEGARAFRLDAQFDACDAEYYYE